MAFQRPFLISLKRSDSSQKWGFGIKGGKDYGEPLTIQSVVEDSLAERCGLREGDEIIQVGRVNVQDLPLGQVYELLARCGNKIEMFIVREDLFSPRKGKEPGVIKAVVHNPYNSPLSLYSTENIADTLAKQTEVLTEGQFSGEEEEGPENLSFKEKSAVFKLLEEQANQEGSTKSQSRGIPQNNVIKPKVAPPPPPKPKPPSEEHLHNGFDSHHQTYQDQQRTSRVEYQTTQKVYNQYQYQQEQPVQYQQSSVYQVNSQQRSPGYHSPSLDQYPSPGYSSPISQYQQHPGYQSPTNYQNSQQVSYQQNSYQHSPQSTYQQSQQSSYQQYQTPPKPVNQQFVNQHQPAVSQQQQLQQSSYQQNQIQNQQSRDQKQQSYIQQTQQQQRQQTSPQQSNQPQRQQISPQQSNQQQRQQISPQQSNQQQRQQQTHYQQSTTVQETPAAVSKAEFKVRPAPPPRNVPRRDDRDTMAAVYKQQYEQHLQQVNEQHQAYMNNIEEDDKPRAHIINGNIFEHNSTSGTPITYKAPPAAPPKPNWPPPPSSADSRLLVESLEPTGMDVGSVWPPKRSTTTDLPRTGFDPAAVRAGQGSGRRCVWPPPSDEMRSGRNTPQSPIGGRKIQWNPSPSPPQSRRNLFSPSHSPARRKDIQWPPPSPTSNFDKENVPRQSPRLSRKAQFDDYVNQHASINVPQTYRPPPGTQHVEFY